MMVTPARVLPSSLLGRLPSRACVFVVVVHAVYGLEGYDPAVGDWVVRVVAFDHAAAESAAVAFLGLHKPAAMQEGAVLVSAHATTLDRLVSVDCIAESVVRP